MNDNHIISVITQEINHCHSELLQIQGKFFSPIPVFVSILACGLAGMSAGFGLYYLLVLLPSVFLFLAYNTLKYTIRMLKLYAYKCRLEDVLQGIIKQKLLIWESDIMNDRESSMVGIFIQFLFIFPAGIILLYLCFEYLLSDGCFLIYPLNVVAIIIIGFQFLAIMYMVVIMCKTKTRTYKLCEALIPLINDTDEDNKNSNEVEETELIAK